MLRLTTLPDRINPAPFDPASVSFDPYTLYGFVGQIETVGIELPGRDGRPGKLADVYVGASEGNGSRVVVRDNSPSLGPLDPRFGGETPAGFRTPGSPDELASFEVFEADWRGGVKLAEVTRADGTSLLVIVPGGTAGGPRAVVVEFDADANVVRMNSFFAMEASYRLSLEVTGGDVDGDGADEVVIEGGVGSAPVLRGFNPLTGETVLSVYIGPEDDRRGAAGWHLVKPGFPVVSVGGRSGVYVQDGLNTATTTFIPLPGFKVVTDIIRAEPHPVLPAPPADVAAAQAVVDGIPTEMLRFLKAHDIRLYVYGGRVITDLPQFAGLAGVMTGVGGDGLRTFDAVPAAFSGTGDGGTAGVVNIDSLYAVTHELGHGVESHFTPDQLAEWGQIHATAARWPKPYEALNAGEAAAESVRRWAYRIGQPDPRIDPFLDGVMAPYVG